MIRFSRILCCFVVLACCVPLAAHAQLCPTESVDGSDYSPWPKFHHDIRNTGKTSYFGTQVGKLKWKFITNSPVTSSPVLHCQVDQGCYSSCTADGDADSVCVKECQDCTVYVGSADNNFYAIDAETGSLKWKYTTDGAIEFASPAIDENHVLYIGSNDGYLYAFDLTLIDPLDPQPEWVFNPRTQSTGKATSVNDRPTAAISSSPSINEDGSILFASNDGNLYSISPAGQYQWAHYIDMSWNSPAIDTDNDVVWIGSWNDQYDFCDNATGAGVVPCYKSYYALNTADGTLADFGPGLSCTPGGIIASPVLAPNGDVIISWLLTFEDWGLEYCDDDCADNGIWRLGLGRCLDTAGKDVYSTPAMLEDNSFLTMVGNEVWRVLPDGANYFSVATIGARSESSPAVDGEKIIFVGANGGYFYAVCADCPETPVLWQYPPEGDDPLMTENGITVASIVSSPAIGNDTRHSVYVGASDGCVYAFYDGARIYGTVQLVEDGTSGPLRAVKLTLTSTYTDEVRVTYTDPDGNFEFAGVENLSYTVTPEKIGYVFTPPTGTALVSGDRDTQVTFEASTGFTLSGTITDSGGAPLSGVSVKLESTLSPTASTTTGADGAYSFAGLGYDTYTVTPTLSGYGFTPPFREVTLSSAASSGDTSGIDFTGTNGYQISGQAITYATQEGLPGVTISLTGTESQTGLQISPRSDTTGTDGSYSFVGLNPGTYTVTPFSPGVTFEPPSSSVTIAAQNIDTVDFVAITGFSISGTIDLVSTDNATPSVTEVDVQLYENAAMRSVTDSEPLVTVHPDSDGAFVFIGVENGSYIVKPVLTDYGFTPGSEEVTVAGSDVTDLSFTAASGLYISGRVVNSIGRGYPGVSVNLTVGETTSTTETASDGSYSFTGLEQGTYTVEPEPEEYTSYPAARSVSLASQSRENVNFLVSSQCTQAFFAFPFAGGYHDIVNIYGTNFGWNEPPEDETVSIDGEAFSSGVYFGTMDTATWVQAEVTYWTNNKIVVEAPAGFGLVRIWVVRVTKSDNTGCAETSPTNFFLYIY